jgi:hypothetical protein
MPESHSSRSLETDAVVDHVRSLWRDASNRARACGVELYAKLSGRTRIERGGSSAGHSIRHALETGLAIRALTCLIVRSNEAFACRRSLPT